MSRTNLRYGGVALAGTLALGFLINQSAVATTSTATPLTSSVIEQALAGLPDAASANTAAAIPAGFALPQLSHLSIPSLAATVEAVGYAQTDVRIDVFPKSAERDLSFVLQRKHGKTWVEAATGTTKNAAEVATLPNLPAGTYRLILPAQYGMTEVVGSAFQHQPRQLTAKLTYNPDTYVTTVDVSPNPDDAYKFTLQRKSNGAWQNVESLATSSASGGYGFTSIPSGTYRIVVPDQANALGATSKAVEVTSRADAERAAAEEAARAAAAAAPAPAPTPAPATTPGRTSAPSPAPAPAPAPAPSYSDAPGGNGSITGSALAQVGDRYVLGASGPHAFDCSGLTSFAYRAAGKSIPRTSQAQWAAAAKVSNPQPGDLVFFNGAGHVGIYLGNGQMVHAPNPSRSVEVVNVYSSWYGQNLMGFGRF